MRCVLCLALLGLALPAQADPAWRGQWDITLHATASTTQLRTDSVLNPGNTIAHLSENVVGGEARINLRLESDALRLTLRPILSSQQQDNGGVDDARLSQWQLRAVLVESVSLSFGREVMNWGPAQFRSPSSPFYFDNGRANPSRELTGVDSVKLAWTPDASTGLSLAWVKDGGEDTNSGNGWNNTVLLKGEKRGDDWTGGLILARAAGRETFVGAYAQWTLDEAWLLYGEAASATRADALVSPADPALPFSLQTESARQTTALLGALRTFENGHSLSLEYLYDEHGYRDAEAAAYFSRATTSLPTAALALGQAPALLGRNYLNLVWQSNQLEDGDYWRAMWSRNLDDGSNAWTGYFDHPINRHLAFYALATLNSGGPRREFAALIEHNLLLGLRLALP
jgi:hypothetical protein